MDTSGIDFVGLVRGLKRVSGTNGGEYAGACPFCGGDDRFRLWAKPRSGNPRAWCRRCGFSGDAIEFVMRRDNCDFVTACSTLGLQLEQRPKSFSSKPPRHVDVNQSAASNLHSKAWVGLHDHAWQAAARAFINYSFNLVFELHPAAEAGRRYLEDKRCLSSYITDRRHIGFNPHSHKAKWGALEVWLPAGVVIPWVIEGDVWRVNIRRLDGSEPKYIQPAGCANGLYNADKLTAGCTAVLVEGEFDALAIEEAQTQLHIIPVATGSTNGSRLYRWIGALALCEQVLVAFDADEAGEQAAAWWMNALPRARRLCPTRHDVSDMLAAGDDILTWLLDA